MQSKKIIDKRLMQLYEMEGMNFGLREREMVLKFLSNFYALGEKVTSYMN